MSAEKTPDDSGYHLDLTSEPPSVPSTNASKIGKRENASASQRVRLYFGCCRVSATLIPPDHVLRGDTDIWRAHCPRCGGLTEIFFQ